MTPDALPAADRGLTMHVEVRRADDVVIVDLSGKLTAGLGDQILRDTIDELLAESWKKILLNLSQVSFMDSAGWASWWRACAPRGSSGPTSSS